LLLRAIALFTWHLLFCPQNARRMAITYATLGGSHVSIPSWNDEDRRLRRTSKARHLSSPDGRR
jgi:hypothetical protein